MKWLSSTPAVAAVRQPSRLSVAAGLVLCAVTAASGFDVSQDGTRDLNGGANLVADGSHDGAFRCQDILARAGTGYTSNGKAGGVTLDGDAPGDGPSGTCEILGSIVNYQSRNDYGDPNMPVIVKGYRSVSIGGDILTSHASARYSDNAAGDIQIADIAGDIAILGALDAHAARGLSLVGDVLLETTAGSGGKIVLGDESAPGANMLVLTTNVATVAFGADGGRSYIYHEIVNFVPGAPNSQLLVQRDGDEVLYAFEDEGLNSALRAGGLNGVYEIQSLAGGVGYLKPLVAVTPGTVILLR